MAAGVWCEDYHRRIDDCFGLIGGGDGHGDVVIGRTRHRQKDAAVCIRSALRCCRRGGAARLGLCGHRGQDSCGSGGGSRGRVTRVVRRAPRDCRVGPGPSGIQIHLFWEISRLKMASGCLTPSRVK